MVAEEQGAYDEVREWCQRARDVVADAPDSVAVHHHWIER